jgi:mRNA interferase RelE/StbE
MTRAIYWDPKARNDLEALDGHVKRRIHSAIERLADDHGDVRRLTGIAPPLFRFRVGDWRVLFRFDEEKVVILRVLPRDKVYR